MVLGLALLALLAFIVRLTLRTYRIHLHPLRSFKGPEEACISENWLYKVTKKGAAEETFEALHKKYSMNYPLQLKKQKMAINGH
jgi:hypothetical protein